MYPRSARYLNTVSSIQWRSEGGGGRAGLGGRQNDVFWGAESEKTNKSRQNV